MNSTLWLSLYTKPLPLFSILSLIYPSLPLSLISLSFLEAPLFSYALSSMHLHIRSPSRLIIQSFFSPFYASVTIKDLSIKDHRPTSAIPIPAPNGPLSNKHTLIYITIWKFLSLSTG